MEQTREFIQMDPIEQDQQVENKKDQEDQQVEQVENEENQQGENEENQQGENEEEQSNITEVFEETSKTSKMSVMKDISSFVNNYTQTISSYDLNDLNDPKLRTIVAITMFALFMFGMLQTQLINMCIMYLLLMKSIQCPQQFETKKFTMVVAGTMFFTCAEFVSAFMMPVWILIKLIQGRFYYELVRSLTSGVEMTLVTDSVYNKMCEVICHFDKKINLQEDVKVMINGAVNCFSSNELGNIVEKASKMLSIKA